MDLKEMNGEYLKLKANLAQKRSVVEKLEAAINDLVTDQTIWKGKIAEAQKNKDTNAEEKAKNELKNVEDKIKKVQESATKQREELSQIQSKINDKIEELKRDPAMKEHLEDVLTKQYKRRIKKEKEQKEKLEVLKGILTEHPNLDNYLRGFLVAKTEIENLNNELKEMKDEVNGVVQYKDPVRANEILNTLLPQAEKKKQNNKTPFMAFVTKNKIDISEEDLEKLDVIMNKDKNRTALSAINSRIKGYDKSISNSECAIINMGRSEYSLEPNSGRQTTEEPEKPETTEESEKPEEPEKPKWYQFRKRFKAWNEKRNQRRLAERNPEPETIEEPEEPEKPEKITQSEFKNSLKFEIVQDIRNQLMEQTSKEAKQDRKDIRKIWENRRKEEAEQQEEIK